MLGATNVITLPVRVEPTNVAFTLEKTCKTYVDKILATGWNFKCDKWWYVEFAKDT